MIAAEEVERKVAELLDEFYRRRIDKIQGLELKHALKHKNPYLYRAIGVQEASEIVKGLLTAYMSSSDEGIFGEAFFEPLAKFVSGGTIAPTEGVDVAIETDTSYKAIAVKSGPNVFNAQSKKKQVQDFLALKNRLQKLHKHFDPIVGYCYGKKKQKKSTTVYFRELAGQSFWQEITGDPDFYLKIIELMRDKPVQHANEYRKAFAEAVNRFTKEFVEEFCDEGGAINWRKIVEFNSGGN